MTDLLKIKVNFKNILLLLFCFSWVQSSSQIDDINFRRISPPGGFSFQAVHTFKQDLFGYIWMGTFDGIIRYDSKEIVRYIHNPEKNGIPDNSITGIEIDNKNNIWVSTEAGLCLFNRTTQEFEQINYHYENQVLPIKHINSIALDGNGQLWIADAKYFGYLDKEKNQLIRITEGFTNSPELLYKDETNRLWLGTGDGTIYLVAPFEEKVIKKIDGPGSIAKTILVANKEIWVGYANHGARLYDLNGKLKVHYTYSSESNFNIKTAAIRKIWRDTRGRIWIGSYHGLFLNVGTDLIRFDPDEHTGLPHNSIYSIYEDKQGGIWIGTWSGGVAYLHHADNKFNNYRHSKEPNSLSHNMVSSFAQAPNGDLFVGTEVSGLNKFDIRTKSFHKIKVLETDGILNIKSLCFDNKGGLWVGSAFKGLFYRPNGKSKFIHFPKGKEDGFHVSAVGNYNLCESDSGVWIGTNLEGLNFYNFKTNKISFISKKGSNFQFNNQNCRALTLDSKNNLWTGTLNGMYQYNLSSGDVIPFNTNSISNHKTSSSAFYFVIELSNADIWMGTRGGGINIYNPETDKLSFFDADGLLQGKDVYGIVEGQDNNIWITSNDGLILYNTKNKDSRRFIITDGIQGNLFNPNSIFKDKDNNIYFGGTNGFTQLEPNKIKINNRPPNVFINKIEVNKRSITPSQTAINSFSKILLKPNENTLKFHFSADNYLLPEKNRFKYRLINHSNKWMKADKDRSATFVNIPSGNYYFEVLACNNDGVWQTGPARLNIEIKKIWYKTNLAIVFQILALLIIIIIVFRILLERSNLKKAILIEKLERKNEDQLHEMKLRFFTNISHEFRTPLTLINWPIQKLLRSNNLTIEQQDQLKTVKRNTNRLLLLINQIMDLRKVEKGQTKLNLSKLELIDFVQERMLNFSEEAKSKNIQFTFSHHNEEGPIEADEEKLDKIIYNLLSNAFKFTPQNGKIEITIQSNQSEISNYYSNQLSFGKLENEDFFEIQVIDNGIGIDSEDLPNIFDRFEQGKQKKTKHNGTGIGLNLCKDYTLLHNGEIIVKSSPGKGTSFIVRLPAKQRAQKFLYESHKKVKNINSWQAHTKSENTTKLHENGNILIVEDNDELREYLIQFLNKYHSVFFAENGKEGLEIVKKRNIDLVVSDVMMPIMDGFEFCDQIKSHLETSHIPVVLLTALSSSENTATGLEKGADAYISKPFDENILLSQINNLLLQRKRLKESYTHKYLTKQPINLGNLDNYFLKKVNSTIEYNITNEEFSVEMLAKEIGLSRSQLHRKLKQISSHTTSEYILMVKIKKATTLLASKEFNIDEIAFKTGFSSHSYFTKCFKKIHNKSPKEFLKEL